MSAAPVALPDPDWMSDDTIRAGMLDLFTSAMKEERTGRRGEVKTAWRTRAFRNGDQQLYYDSGSHAWMDMEASGKELPVYRRVYNITAPRARSLGSILSQNPPGINFQPDDLQQSNDVTAYTYAEKMRHLVDRLVEMGERQADIALMYCTDGRCTARVYVDKAGKLRVAVYGVLETKRPLFARTQAECSYYVCSREVDEYAAKEQYPDFADEMESTQTSGSADSQYERYARLGVIARNKGGNADSLKGLLTEHQCWIRPSRYRKSADATKAYLLEAFPDGLRMTICGGVVVEAEPERIEDALVEDWPYAGQGGNRPSMLDDVIPLQIDFNDYKNHLREQADYVDALTVVSNDAFDTEGLTEVKAMPDGTIGVTLKTGEKVGDVADRLPGGGMSPELIAACESLMTLGDFISGDLPSLQGEGDEHAETLGGQKLLTNQAKGQLTAPWKAMQRQMAGIYKLGITKAAMLYGDSPVLAVQGESGQESFNPAAILEGKWGCYADPDSSFPETTADKRASFQMFMTQYGQADPKIPLHPDNMALAVQLSGNPNIIVPAAEARKKQLREIEQMLREPPVPDTESPQYPAYLQNMQQWELSERDAQRRHFANHLQSGGAMESYQPPTMDLTRGRPQPPLKPSVDVDEDWDFHQAEMDKVQEWLSSESRMEEERKGNFMGIQNVKLHGMAHKAVLAKQAAAANQPQQTPMSISGAFKDLDPQTKVQVLQRDGYQPDASAYEAEQVQGEQASAAETAHTAAKAQHQGVLAAKEAVEPAGGFRKLTMPNPGPEQAGPGEK